MKKIVESLVIHLSDAHADQIIMPSRVGGLETYNLAIAAARGERFVEKIIRHCKGNLKGYRFDEIVILAYGDHVSGQIHEATSYSHYQNLFQSSIGVGRIYAYMMQDLHSAFRVKVRAYFVSGNHGRLTQKKDFEGPRRNWDFLVAESARGYLANESDITIHTPDSFDAYIRIKSSIFHIQHGDDIRAWSGTPWYGIARAVSALQNIRHADYYCMGHFHRPGTAEVGASEVFLNGAWVATTPYIYSQFHAQTKPQQLIHGVHRKYGASWRLPINLKFPEDVQGPKRYFVEPQ